MFVQTFWAIINIIWFLFILFYYSIKILATPTEETREKRWRYGGYGGYRGGYGGYGGYRGGYYGGYGGYRGGYGGYRYWGKRDDSEVAPELKRWDPKWSQ